MKYFVAKPKVTPFFLFIRGKNLKMYERLRNNKIP